jgi:ketosteroid isomerase-like protein
LSATHLPDINANKSASGSCGLVSFEAKITGRSDGSAADGVAKKTMVREKICQQLRIVFWRSIVRSSVFQV